MQYEEKFTAAHRVLHWFTALSMTILFLTGFLRMYWMGKLAVADAIASQGIEVSKEQAKAVYKALREPMWEWHIIFAYVMIAVFVLRILYMLFNGPRFASPFRSQRPLKIRLQAFTYVYFYAFILISILTGISLRYSLFLEWKGSIEAVHKWGVYIFPIFITLHLMGIIIGESTDKKGVVSKMIGGD